MEVKVEKPREHELKKFIRHFYFLKTDSEEFRQSYLTFPQLTTPLSLFVNVRTYLSADRTQAHCWHDRTAGLHAEVDGIFTRPMRINYRGKIDEVTVVFEPLGLNQFLRCDLAEVAVGGASRSFNPYGAEFHQFLGNLFADDKVERRLSVLEDFFRTNYRPFDNEILSRALECLRDTENKTPISQLAQSLGVSHKTITRLFQRHIGATPILVRRIARFRRSLELKFGDGLSKLAQIAHLSDYYDQSQFIKQIHELTGESPASFFRHVSIMGGKDIFWRML
jgi:AraC-like DNA-binding protein